MKLIQSWFQRQFSDPQVVILAVFLLVGFGIVFLLGDILMPVLASVVIAYLLEGSDRKVTTMQSAAPTGGFCSCFLLFMAFLVFVLFGLLPMLTRQIGEVSSKIAGG